jgi:bifunctional non-homologous end joining protein LigD
MGEDMLKFIPMSPILVNELPNGKEWGHQLKWDGYRLIAWITDGVVELYSKKMLSLNSKFPELVQALSELKGTFLLDGEAVILDPKTNRPSFQMLQNRTKTKGDNSVQYIIFDMLQFGVDDLRQLPFNERHKRLHNIAKDWKEPLFLTDLFEDGEALWNWVKTNDWEGVVSKRLSSPYREGKRHQDWYKRKRSIRLEVEIVGVLMKLGSISSLIMRREGLYFGRNSAGLNREIKALLAKMTTEKTATDYFNTLPEALKGQDIRWFTETFTVEVTGTEITDAGTLRHPQIVG